MFEFFTERAKEAIVASQDEAIALGHDFIGTEHLLLGLAGTEGGTAGQVLAALGADRSRLRAAVLAAIAPETA
ncbi:Clp protease N-terminal domain-containing protein [Streptomyces sp. NPDC048361]|uniref:Clp protease N-terminal domain-containing protein n=1 Tax=Streptomyces sp. NPDC048361 TaxID=3154720 RepID=UPI003412FEC1